MTPTATLGKRIGFEFKLDDALSLTRSMTTARDELELARLWVIAPTERPYELAERIRVLPLAQVPATTL
jgi:hypothetical protein